MPFKEAKAACQPQSVLVNTMTGVSGRLLETPRLKGVLVGLKEEVGGLPGPPLASPEKSRMGA